MNYCYATIIRDPAEMHNEKIYTVKIDDGVIGGLGAGRSLEQSIIEGAHTLTFFVDGKQRQSIDFVVTPERKRVTMRVKYNERTANIDVSFSWNPGQGGSYSAGKSKKTAAPVKKGAGLCVIALVLGIAALALSRVSLAAVILAIPAVICGLVCIVQSRKQFGLAIAGLILGIFACYFVFHAYQQFEKTGEDIPLIYSYSQIDG